MHIGTADLTYCSNIHAAEGWTKVFESLKQYTTQVKQRVSPGAPFGLGLRLSNEEALTLRQEDQFSEFAGFLDAEGIYVALLNGFPYGHFHGQRLKDQVFAPDWHTAERVDYTLTLVDILGKLLPENSDGGVSTCPLSYKPWFSHSEPDWDILVANLVRVISALVDLKRNHGRTIHLDVEPEPDGLVENTAEFIAFFERMLQSGTPRLAQSLQISTAEAESAIYEHLALCYDLCHFAVEHEDVQETIDKIQAVGIKIGRVQISSALAVNLPGISEGRDKLRTRLLPLVDPVYLHQVIGDCGRFSDLAEGLQHLESSTCSDWRIHYHVPLFLEDYGELRSTQAEVSAAIKILAPLNVQHYEIETYTWGVLPPQLKLDIVDSIEREYQWVLNQL